MDAAMGVDIRRGAVGTQILMRRRLARK
jgi:hypothetical protein